VACRLGRRRSPGFRAGSAHLPRVSGLHPRACISSTPRQRRPSSLRPLGVARQRVYIGGGCVELGGLTPPQKVGAHVPALPGSRTSSDRYASRCEGFQRGSCRSPTQSRGRGVRGVGGLPPPARPGGLGAPGAHSDRLSRRRPSGPSGGPAMTGCRCGRRHRR
jgi:hypothetical protein